MSGQSTSVTAHYPDCAGCGEPVRYDATRAYYQHEDTGELLHVDCYDRYVDTET